MYTPLKPLRTLSLLLLLATPPASFAELNNQLSADETITLNFVDADIRSVIATISKQTGKNFLIDPRVKGKLTIYSGTPVSAAALYDVFISALRTNGYTTIEQDNITHIVPLMQAKQSPTPVRTYKSNHKSAKQITQVIKINNISAVKLIPVLRPLMPKEGYIAAYASTNLIIISDSEQNIARLLLIINSMDKQGNHDIDIIPLVKADASQILKTLKSMQPKSSKSSQKILFSVDKRTNSILLSGSIHERQRIKNIIAKLDAPVKINSSHHVIYLKHASAKELAPILDKIINAKQKSVKNKKNTLKEKSSIIADESTNSIIISAELDEFRSLSEVIKQLDIPRLQVMIEAIIAEVSMDQSEKLGVEWGVAGQIGDITGVTSSTNTGSLISAMSSISDGEVAQAAAAVATGGFSGLLANESFGALINVLKGDSDFNILSAPRILTVDNKEAEIIVGENVPFLTGSFTQTTGGTSNPFQTVKREDVGLTLRVKPQINAGGRIGLEIYQEISTVKNSSAAVDLTTTKRSIKSNVLINDGKILALGGLMDDVTTDTLTGIPLLMDIPYLGWFFSSQNTTVEKRTLMVFIKPTILNNQADSDAITQHSFDVIQKEQTQFNAKDLLIDAEQERYQLPEMNTFTPEKISDIKIEQE